MPIKHCLYLRYWESSLVVTSVPVQTGQTNPKENEANALVWWLHVKTLLKYKDVRTRKIYFCFPGPEW